MFVSIIDFSNWLQNCFLDIIQAYKGVVKEKEALEKSFSALTEVKPLDEQKVSKDNHEPNQSTEQQVESTDVSTEESAEKNTVCLDQYFINPVSYLLLNRFKQTIKLNTSKQKLLHFLPPYLQFQLRSLV